MRPSLVLAWMAVAVLAAHGAQAIPLLDAGCAPTLLEEGLSGGAWAGTMMPRGCGATDLLREPPDLPARAPADGMNPVLKAALIHAAGDAFTLSALSALPPSVTLWRSRAHVSNLVRAYTTPPVWDDDWWGFNYVGHPLAGSASYLLVREQGGSPLASFLFSTAQSVAWEYGWEVLVEQPSITDLLITSTTGSLLGEARHQLGALLRRGGLTTLRKVLLTLVDPEYVILNGYREAPEVR
jgi:hypothetical protein